MKSVMTSQLWEETCKTAELLFTGVEVGARKNCMEIKEEDRNLCDLCKFIILKLIIRNQVNVPCNFNSLRK